MNFIAGQQYKVQMGRARVKEGKGMRRGSVLDFVNVKHCFVKWTIWIYFLNTYYSTSGTFSDFLVQKDRGWILHKIKTFLMPTDSPYDFE